MRKVIHFAMILFASVAVLSCKKSSPTDNNNNNNGNVDGPSKNGSPLDLMRDSVFLYAKEAYYWNDGLPDYATFKPRSFTGSDELGTLTSEVNAISQYKINPATGKPYEYEESSPGSAKYSFIDNGETSTELGGSQGNFGLSPQYLTRTDLRIKYVYPGSPAGNAGVKRGDKVISINGDGNIAIEANNNVPQLVINAFFYSNNITLVLERGGSRFTKTISAGQYNTNPVITYKVFDGPNGKIGYFVFNTFTSPENATPRLNEAIDYFASNNVTNLIIDLRYNGGGYVSTAEYLCNLMVPSSKNNSLMYSTHFNSILTSGKASILANQVRRDPKTNQVYNYAQFDYSVEGNNTYFSKKGSLGTISKICFIVGGGTASASELVINNMKGLGNVDVKIIGSKTYGKPVGFFDIKINKYEMYIPEFETKNALGQGGYYNGMAPETAEYQGKLGNDDITHDFGDPQETLLSYALNFINLGRYTTSSTQLQVQSLQQSGMLSIEQATAVERKLEHGKFSGMVYDKPLKRQ